MMRLPYRSLTVWTKALMLAKKSYELTKSFPKEEQYGLISQIRRSASSIAANIAEGSQRGTDKDFAQFLSIACGSLAELETHFFLAKEVGYFDEKILDELLLQTTEVSKMLHAFRKKLVSY